MRPNLYTTFNSDRALFKFREAVRELETTPLSEQLMQELYRMVKKVESELDFRDGDSEV